MKEKIIIVGSGASGVHFALSVLRKGYDVLMLDIGYERPSVVNPEDTFIKLKNQLMDPVRYFLGESYQGVTFPDAKSEYYGFPPNKDYVFRSIPQGGAKSSGFEPLFSHAQGGLGEAWTGGVYPFNDDDLRDFPFGYSDIARYYEEVADRIGVTGVSDDLSTFLPRHKHLMDPPMTDDHSSMLLSAYEKRKESLNQNLGFFMGRSRIAVLTKERPFRKACLYDGRCLWGCPCDALYTPSITLRECKGYPNFSYIPGLFCSHFKFNSENKIISVIAESMDSGTQREFHLDKLILAAGTLSSSRIFMESIFRNSGNIIKLPGLMDNRQILVPFVNLKMIGKPYNPDSYQYNQIAIGIHNGIPGQYVHGLITTLKTALIHPIVQSMPFDLKTSIFMFRNIHSALGIVNLNFHDTRRESNYVTLEAYENELRPRLVIRYSPEEGEIRRVKTNLLKVKKALWNLGCIVPPGLIHVRPMGASVHYSGTIPMSTKKEKFTVSKYCQSNDFENFFIVDGTTFPAFPAKNLTFTLMANAVRVAECAF